MHWATLRGLGNSRAVQLSVLFPIVGYLILFNDEVARFLSMTALESAPQSSGLVSTLWKEKLHFLYFGLMALGLGSLLYQTSCPFIIKKHGDASDYVRVDGDTMSDEQMRDLGKRVQIDYPYSVSREVRDNLAADVMRRWYNLQSQSKPVRRWMISFLFVSGLALLAVPSTLTAWKVAAIGLRHLS